MLKYQPIWAGHDGPIMIEASSSHLSLPDLVLSDLSGFKQRLTDHGALLFRGFRVADANDFDAFIKGISNRHFEYTYRSSPREGVTANVLTSTSYPQGLDIPMHSENSYQRKWPLIIAFCCIVAPVRGGETPLASTAAVSDHIGSELMSKFEQLGIEYVRHFHDCVDMRWQDVFQTESREVARKYCMDNDISYEWLESDILRTSHVAQGVANHPVKATKVFFNQAHLFHASGLGRDRAEALAIMFGAARLPRHARFGDGTEITGAELEHVRQAFQASTMAFHWQRGDVLVLDNMQYCHGRRAFEGKRSVFAALMEPYPSYTVRAPSA